MPTVTIHGERQDEFITLEQVFYDDCDMSRVLAISVAQNEFRGAMNVWVDEAALSRFVSQFRECEKTRRGEVYLDSISPREFELRIFNTNSKGDFALTYSMCHGIDEFASQLKGGFAIDPSLLRQILGSFEMLLVSGE